MTHWIDQVNYDAIMHSCPKCNSMNTGARAGGGAICHDCGYEEGEDGKEIKPGNAAQGAAAGPGDRPG